VPHQTVLVSLASARTRSSPTVKSIPRDIPRTPDRGGERSPEGLIFLPLRPISTYIGSPSCTKRERRRSGKPSPFECVTLSYRSSFSLYSCTFSVAGVGSEPT
jgi:hypothetical protein